MADPRIEALNRASGKVAHPCDRGCKYFAYPHLPKACVLFDVFAVKQGEACYEYVPIPKTK